MLLSVCDKRVFGSLLSSVEVESMQLVKSKECINRQSSGIGFWRDQRVPEAPSTAVA